MKLGFVSAILADQTFEEVITFASIHQFDCVELMCWPVGKAERRYAGVTHVDVANYDPAAIKAAAKAKGVEISALGYYPNLLEADIERREACKAHLLKVIEASAALGVYRTNTFIGREHTLNDEKNWKLFSEIWPGIIRHAEEHGVKIGIENCPMYFSQDEWPSGKNLATTPAAWERMFHEIDSPNFGLNYDPSHLLWQMIDYIAPIYEFREKIFHVHIKDAKIYRDRLNRVGILATPLEFHAPKLPGLGDVDWGAYISALTDIGYDDCCCIEVEDRAFEGSPAAIEKSLIQSRDYMRQFLARGSSE